MSNRADRRDIGGIDKQFARSLLSLTLNEHFLTIASPGSRALQVTSLISSQALPKGVHTVLHARPPQIHRGYTRERSAAPPG